MHRISIKRLTACVSMAAGLALLGSSTLFSAPAPGFVRKAAARRTTGASTSLVSGTVVDGSGHGWPLYSQLEFTSATTEPVDVYTDPVTGQYQVDLFTDVDYTVAVTAFDPGYNPALRRVHDLRRLARPGLVAHGRGRQLRRPRLREHRVSARALRKLRCGRAARGLVGRHGFRCRDLERHRGRRPVRSV